MALLQEIQVPLLAVNDTSLTVVEMNFASGQPVKAGELIMVLETSKTTYDVEAGMDGYIQYLCELDHDYQVNEIVARIFSEVSEATAAKAVLPKASSAVSPTAFPSVSPAVSPGATPAASPSASPVVLQSIGASPEAGFHGNGQLIHSTSSQTIPVRAFGRPASSWNGEPLFSREALRLVESAGIDRSLFTGRDFVNKFDVEEILYALRNHTGSIAGPAIPGTTSNGPASAGPTAAGTANSGSDSPRLSSARPSSAGQAPVWTGASALSQRPVLPADPAKVILERLPAGKRREIEYLSEVQSTGLTSTIYAYVETEGIFRHMNGALRYLKDSLLPVILYESARLLSDFPLLNAYFTGESIAVYRDINLGFAIDIDKGLKVLKIPATDQKSIAEIEQAVLDLSGNYLEDTLQIEDLTDITFTVTDLSSEGIHFFHPLVNKMNSAILGVSGIDEKLQRCNLALTFDHRVTEGKMASRFLKELKDRLESYRPSQLRADLSAISCFKCFKTLKEDLSGTGFARCITPEGKSGYICQSCLKGF